MTAPLKRPWRSGVLFFAALSLAACAGHGSGRQQATGHGIYKVGKPYEVNGVWYYPAVDYSYAETGIASWYGPDFDGETTADGEIYDMNALTAAHRTLPLPSMVRVTNLENGRQIALRVNDRGPYANNRIIDVSRRAAQLLGFEQQGTAQVRVEIMEEESRQLAALYGAQPQPASPAIAASSDAADSTQQVAAAAPAGTLTAVALPPPPGAAAAPGAPVAVKRIAKPIVGTATTGAGPLPDGKVVVVPVRKTAMFIQAGAFTDVTNANRLQMKLASLGPARIVPAVVGSQKFYRVRVGPIASLLDADQLLDRVVAAGHPEARLIVD
jgi:rare lipoprotein A